MRISVLAFPGYQALDVIGPLEVFAEANRQLGRAVYQMEVVSTVPGPLVGLLGVGIVPNRTIADPPIDVDTLLIAGGDKMQTHTITADEKGWILETARGARRYGSICTGTFIMAQTGLLAGKRVTTHWARASELAAKYPDMILDADAIFICDGPVCTSAGVTAGLDLALALVEEDCGRNVALDTARELVLYLKRSGGQSQFSAHLSAQMSSVPAIEAVQGFVADNLKADLSVEALAKRAGMSPRNFSRVFRKESGITPKEFVERARVDAARRLIADDMPLQRVASEAGFGTIANLRRAFSRKLLTTPSVYRDNFGSSDYVTPAT